MFGIPDDKVAEFFAKKYLDESEICVIAYYDDDGNIKAEKFKENMIEEIRKMKKLIRIQHNLIEQKDVEILTLKNKINEN